MHEANFPTVLPTQEIGCTSTSVNVPVNKSGLQNLEHVRVADWLRMIPYKLAATVILVREYPCEATRRAFFSMNKLANL